MQNTFQKKTFISYIMGTVLFLTLITVWEMHWKAKPVYNAHLDDDRDLWATQRKELENATSEDIVILGSSRTAFNFRTYVWEEMTGRKPINLSGDGRSPIPVLTDILKNTDYDGTLVVGVTPAIFFAPKGSDRYVSAQQWVDYYYNQTYAQKLSFWVSKPLQRNLVMLTATELDFKNDLDLRSVIDNLPIKGRLPYNPGLPKFGHNDEDRNIYMYEAMVTDTTFRNQVRNMWMSFLPKLPTYEAIEVVYDPWIPQIGELLQEFENRGGKVILIHHEAEGPWLKNFERFLPKARVWDKLVESCKCTAYHFSDYDFMSQYNLPDWSHLSAHDAPEYTKLMVQQLIDDGHLKPNN